MERENYKIAIRKEMDDIADVYGSEKQPFLFRWFQQNIREKTVRIVGNQENRAMLEVGCGNGLLLVELEKSCRCKKIVGLDFSGRMLNMASRRIIQNEGKKVRLVMGSANELPFRSNSFEVAISVNTLTCFERRDMEQLIAEMVRVCKFGGKVVLEIMNRFNPMVRLIHNCYIPMRFVSFRAKSQTLKDICTCMEIVGLEINKVVPIGFPLTILAPSLIIEGQKKINI